MLPLAILAGGYATRLGSLAHDLPKCLIRVNGRPFVDWQLDFLIRNGYKNFVFCVSYKSDLIQKHLGNGSERGINIEYSIDGDTQLGTGGAIQKAIPILGNEFGVVYGDSYLPIDYLTVEQHFLATRSKSLMTVYKNKNQFDTSNVEFAHGKVVNYEKGKDISRMHHIDYGLSFFRATAFQQWADQSSFDLSIVLHHLATYNQLDGFEVYDRFYEIGSLSGIEDFSHYLRKANNEL
jgi:MurNAc alpha-1-phosphate uridylyltransferase